MALFSTRVWVFAPEKGLTNKLGNINQALLKRIQEAKVGAGQSRSARGCWRLEDAHLLDELEDVMEHIRTIITKICVAGDLGTKKRRFSAWVDVMDQWGSHVTHHHAPNLLSGVFYLEVPEGSSNLILRDPRPLRFIHDTNTQAMEIPVQASKGSTIVFPSWLEHYVEASDRNAGRTTLSFNVGEEIGQKATS